MVVSTLREIEDLIPLAEEGVVDQVTLTNIWRREQGLKPQGRFYIPCRVRLELWRD